MKVLFCIGYQKTAFSPQSWKENGSGGSEYSVMKLAERFSELGHEVMVSGEVNLATVVDSETYEKGQTIIYLGGSNFYLSLIKSSFMKK